MQEEYLHGGVGGTDAEKVLYAMGFTPIHFPHHDSFSLWAKIARAIFLVRTLFSISKGSVVVFLHPVYARMNRVLLNWISRKKSICTICFIADIDGIKDGDAYLLKKEIAFFNRFRCFIVHNDKMKEWLIQQLRPGAQIVTIQFFDFLARPFEGRREISHDVAFAGNLQKSSFLEKLNLLQKSDPSLHFHLYGGGSPTGVSTFPNVTWHGVERPEDLPQKLVGSFGLLWDGTSIDEPAGSHGAYMQYISHHKLSLYILAQLPVIAPVKSAAAVLINKNQIGFTVNNLYEIREKIGSLSPVEYGKMQSNMRLLSQRISEGKCLSDALDELLKRRS